ncbi:MAG TPA: ATP-binding protein [Streptosporangiaceae bacterium]|nr:ATP-binding protein [Streptosporangiaceae bacterium]
MRGEQQPNQPVTAEPDDITGPWDVPGAGGEPLRILILEDDPADAELAQRQLTSAGMRFTAAVVDTRASFERQLTAFRPEVILADFSLPGFSGEKALEIAQQLSPRIPFIFLSGVLGDEAAVELIRQGATDYVVKDRPARLPAVIRRAVAESLQRAELVRLEAQLHQAQRLASLGRLAGGVAHEFNNQVGAMINYAAFIREEAARRAGRGAGGDGWDGVRDDAEQIERAGQRVIRLVKQLLAVGGQTTARSEPIDLNQIISGTHELLRASIGGHIELRLCPAPQLWPVTADPAEIRQVLLTLATNASEAMPDGGTFSLVTKNVTIGDHDAASNPGLAPGTYVCLIAADTGTGMEPETVEHAFEPFFTTKPFVQGGGLGLASVYGIVSAAGGTARISAAPAAGTTITIWLPAAAAGRH